MRPGSAPTCGCPLTRPTISGRGPLLQAHELRVASDDDRIQVLGNFEAGLDGWQLSGNGIGVENPYDPLLSNSP